MARGCTRCGECLDVCPVFALLRREEASPKAKRLLMEPLATGAEANALPWETVRQLSGLCAGCGRCARRCARGLSVCELLADARAAHPHWSGVLWEIWICRAGPFWPLAGRAARLCPPALAPPGLRDALMDARALTDHDPGPAWATAAPCTEREAGQPVALFPGCTASRVRPRWIARGEGLLRARGHEVLPGSAFGCCGNTLAHAGLNPARDAARREVVARWRELGRPILACLCASCWHGLVDYAAAGDGLFADAPERALWTAQVRSLAALLAGLSFRREPPCPEAVSYHSPCHWGERDPDAALLKAVFPALRQGTALCCGLGGVLKLTGPDLSAALARQCLQGLGPDAPILTGCGGCVMQLAGAAPPGRRVMHWLDVLAAE